MRRAMLDQPRDPATAEASPWEPPGFEVISLACEISGYAPDDDQPLV